MTTDDRLKWIARRLAKLGSESLVRHLNSQFRSGTTVTQKANPRAFPLPTDPAERKLVSITTAVLDYFPNAIAEVAKVSVAGNDQHNPGQPLHWARGKSTDQADCIARHLIGRGTFDTDGQRHSAKLAWRALALLQEELEADRQFEMVTGEQYSGESSTPGGCDCGPDKPYASCAAWDCRVVHPEKKPEPEIPEYKCYCDTGYVCQGCDLHNDGRPYRRCPGPTYQEAYSDGLLRKMDSDFTKSL